MAPVVAAAAERHRGQVEVVTLDVTDGAEAARELGIRAVPTYIACSPDGEVARRVGRITAGELDVLFAAARRREPVSHRISTADRVLRHATATALAGSGVAARAPALIVIGTLVAAFGLWDLARCR